MALETKNKFKLVRHLLLFYVSFKMHGNRINHVSYLKVCVIGLKVVDKTLEIKYL